MTEREQVLKLIEPLADDAQTDIRNHLANLDGQIEDQQSEIFDLEEQAEGKTGEIASAVNVLLDEVERPVGSLSATLPTTPRTSRALVDLYDAIGRRL